MGKPEKEIQKEILKYAKKHKKIAWIDRANSGKVKVKGGFMQLHESGTPDLIGYAIDGKLIGIEIKTEERYNTENNGLSKDQIDRLNDMIFVGCYAGVACSNDHVDLIMDNIS